MSLQFRFAGQAALIVDHLHILYISHTRSQGYRSDRHQPGGITLRTGTSDRSLRSLGRWPHAEPRPPVPRPPRSVRSVRHETTGERCQAPKRSPIGFAARPLENERNAPRIVCGWREKAMDRGIRRTSLECTKVAHLTDMEFKNVQKVFKDLQKGFAWTWRCTKSRFLPLWLPGE